MGYGDFRYDGNLDDDGDLRPRCMVRARDQRLERSRRVAGETAAAGGPGPGGGVAGAAGRLT